MGISRLGSSTARMVSKANAAGETLQFTVGLAAVTGTSPWYEESASLSADLLVTKVAFSTGAGTFRADTAFSYVEVGIGVSGSEVAIARVPLHVFDVGGISRLAVGSFTVPERVATGQRLSIRLTDGGGGLTSGLSAYLYGILQANTEGN